MKILLIYPNTPLLNPPPISLGIFTALLREAGVDVTIFDTTFCLEELPSDEAKKESLQVRPFQYDYDQLPISPVSPEQGLRQMLENYRPDLVAVSTLESTWDLGSKLVDVVSGVDASIPVLIGGVFPTFAPDLIFRNPGVDMVCIGEGEGALLDVCEAVREGRSCEGIPNIWVRTPQGIVKSGLRPLVDVNALPFPDYSAFHPAKFLRPMAGRIYRTVPIETNRGCPYSCTFCNSPSTVRMYREQKRGHFFRKKKLDTIQRELEFLIEKWDAEYVFFTSDTFLCMNDKEFEQFIGFYSGIGLPFWIQSRAETITRYRAEKLKEIGCHRMSIGLEQGNEEFRRNRLEKQYRNQQMIDAAVILKEVGIPLSVNNIIGFPDETRELIFDTIELNRKVPSDTTNAYAFTPFHGTPLHDYCVEKGWVDRDSFFGCVTVDVPLDMPQLSVDEIRGLRKTFALYAKLPREYWPRIRRAEADDEEGRREYSALAKIYQDMFFS